LSSLARASTLFELNEQEVWLSGELARVNAAMLMA
jgi:hypothetical protein